MITKTKWSFVVNITTRLVITHGTHKVVGKSSGTSLKNLGFSN